MLKGVALHCELSYFLSHARGKMQQVGSHASGFVARFVSSGLPTCGTFPRCRMWCVLSCLLCCAVPTVLGGLNRMRGSVVWRLCRSTKKSIPSIRINLIISTALLLSHCPVWSHRTLGDLFHAEALDMKVMIGPLELLAFRFLWIIALLDIFNRLPNNELSLHSVTACRWVS